jgi:LAS superfamily LD-carboxypeptidase LdcB
MNSASQAKINDLDPRFASLVWQLLSNASAQGTDFEIVSGRRSTAEQQRLWDNRASNPNPVAVPGTSLHEKGLAIDVRITRGSLNTLGTLAESLGMTWGARWAHKDPGHFQLDNVASPEVLDGSMDDGGSLVVPVLVGLVLLFVALEL